VGAFTTFLALAIRVLNKSLIHTFALLIHALTAAHLLLILLQFLMKEQTVQLLVFLAQQVIAYHASIGFLSSRHLLERDQ
jgi:hypothetical protein